MGFAYSTLIDEIFSMLPFSDQLNDDQREQMTTAISLLVDRDDELSAYAAGVLEGEADETVIATATGGATIEFSRPMRRIPRTIVVSVADDAGGAILNTVPASKSKTGFAVQAYDVAGVELNGPPVRVAWAAYL